MTSVQDFKVVLLGSQSVGKTSLVMRYVEGSFAGKVPSTIGASFFTHKLTVDNVRVKLQIWDTAGQERFRSMAPMYYRNASAAMLVYDVTNSKSFEEIRGWVTELQSNTDEGTLICLLANKVDLLETEADGADAIAKGRNFADTIGALFFKTSAPANEGIDDAFLGVVQRLLVKANSGKGTRRAADIQNVVDVAKGEEDTSSRSCCR